MCVEREVGQLSNLRAQRCQGEERDCRCLYNHFDYDAWSAETVVESSDPDIEFQALGFWLYFEGKVE